jgi:hypothetical protein
MGCFRQKIKFCWIFTGYCDFLSKNGRRIRFMGPKMYKPWKFHHNRSTFKNTHLPLSQNATLKTLRRHSSWKIIENITDECLICKIWHLFDSYAFFTNLFFPKVEENLLFVYNGLRRPTFSKTFEAIKNLYQFAHPSKSEKNWVFMFLKWRHFQNGWKIRILTKTRWVLYIHNRISFSVLSFC